MMREYGVDARNYEDSRARWENPYLPRQQRVRSPVVEDRFYDRPAPTREVQNFANSYRTSTLVEVEYDRTRNRDDLYYQPHQEPETGFRRRPAPLACEAFERRAAEVFQHDFPSLDDLSPRNRYEPQPYNPYEHSVREVVPIRSPIDRYSSRREFEPNPHSRPMRRKSRWGHRQVSQLPPNRLNSTVGKRSRAPHQQQFRKTPVLEHEFHKTQTGTILRLNTRGFGFIESDANKNQYFFPAMQVRGGRIFSKVKPGDRCTFILGRDPKRGKVEAHDVRVVDP